MLTITKDVYAEYVCVTTTKHHSFDNFNSIILFIFISNKKLFETPILHFSEDYENIKGWTRWYVKCANRDVQKRVQGDDQENIHNCIGGGAISTTTCFKCME